jgi:2-C-methyl-D-erythritol 2,4-cyclodiphosphate synthase
MRIGFGYDAHRYGDVNKGQHIRLGGVDVPYERSIEAHSDGDVIIHALCDAILGALALGDIGQHFPDTEARYKGVDSRTLLKECYRKVLERKLELSNVDITLIAERPKVREYVNEMRQVIAGDLNASAEQVSIKATTTEKMGFIGREEGLAAHAVVLLE